MAALTGGMALGLPRLLQAGEPDFKALADAALTEDTFWKVVRRQFVFPEDYAYLNTGGIGAVPSLVLQAVKQSMDEGQVYPSPGHDNKEWLAVKNAATAFFGETIKPEEIALTNSATEGINIILNGLPLQPEDEIITSTHEHAALLVPLLNLKERKGIVIRTFEPDLSWGYGNVERISELINKKTKLIFFSHVTCTTGQRFFVEKIGEIAKQNQIWFALDGAQAVGRFPMDIVSWGVDFYACSGHKWCLGPKRTGMLYVGEALLDLLRPTTVGAYSDNGFDLSARTLKLHPSAQRYEYATQNESLYVGLHEALKFIQTIGLPRIARHNRKLSEAFYWGLTEIPGVQLLSPKEDTFRTSMISFKHEKIPYREIGNRFAEQQIRVRVVPEAGLEGVRISFHLYNSEDDVSRALEVVKSLE